MHLPVKPAALLLTLGLALNAFSQVPAANRIAQAIDDRDTVQLQGNVRPFLQQAVDQGRMDGGIRLESVALVFKRTAAQDADIEKLLADSQNTSSPSYHKWLTPEQYADRFGLSPGDVNKVVSWLESEGFTVNRVARGRTAVFFSGTVAQVETVFRTEMHHYLVKGEPHFANSVEPSVPAALAVVVAGLTHLDDFRPKARVTDHMTSPQLTSHYNFNGQHVVAPDDFATIYDLKPLYTATLNGSGQTIAIVGQSALYTTVVGGTTNYPDLDAFRTAFKLPARSSTNFVATLVPGTGASPGVVKGDVDESNIDLEWSAGVAPGVNEIFFYAGVNGSAFDAILWAIDNNSAPIVSSSYGNCEPVFTSSQLQQLVTAGQQANVQGQTIVAAVGDQGPADCDASSVLPAQGGVAVDVPAALPYATGVGGSEFDGDLSNPSQYWSSTNNSNNGSALSYIPETTWNDTTLVNMLDTTGGGVSRVFSKPNWQAGTGVPSDGARDVPDIALNGSNEHDPYVFCTSGNTSCSNSLAGGTSFGAPTFAGIVAILNQKIGATNGQGNVNPTLYSLAASTPSAFHDITTGNNIVPCGQGTSNCPTTAPFQYGYSAGVGYDLVTGLGSLDVNNLANAWSSGNTTVADFQMYGTVATIAAPGGTATSTITVDGRNGFSGAVSLTCTAPASALISCSLSSSSVTPSGTTNTASTTLTIKTTAATARLEHQTPPLWWTGSGTLFAGVFLFGVPARRRRWGIAMTLLVVAFVASLAACGGGSSSPKSPGTPAGSYTVSVTGTSASLSHTTNVSVVVQ